MRLLVSRRGFGLGMIASAVQVKGKEQTPHAKFPTDARHRLSVSTYPFRSVIAAANGSGAGANTTETGKPKISLQQFASTIPSEFGVYGIEPWSRHFESIEPSYVRELSEAFKKARVKVVNIPCDVRVRLCGTEAERREGIDSYKRWADAAVTLSSPSIRVHVPQSEKPGALRCAI